MWSDQRKNIPARGFFTPPATWNTPPSPAVMPLSERKVENSPACKRDLFHVIHKVPSGDSPYVKAKHVQLIEKDPSKAISLFWAAINAGDRVDSALKDMAVVMKQLNRSDEAIEAIKSFRHLCPYESQESIDNVLVELYKRSGRIEEEIEMLQRKLKDIEEGMAFGGRRTKIARSQGKKIQLTVDQERSRILGNLAWAYLQHHDYGLAEEHYRKALLLEPDKNKQCNLAMCLMHMNRLPEAKSLLQDVRLSCGSRQMDDSYAKSYDRAFQMLSEFESQRALASQNKAAVSPSPVLYTQPRKCSWDRSNGDYISERIGGCKVQEPANNIPPRSIRNLNKDLLDSTNEKSQTPFQRAKSSLPLAAERDLRRFGKNISHGKEHGMTNNWRPDTCALMNLRKVIEPGWKYNMWNKHENGVQIKYAKEDINASKYEALEASEFHQKSNANVPDSTMSTAKAGGDIAAESVHKSWADIAEEDEQVLLAEKDSSQYFNNRKSDEETNNENIDSNLIYQNSCSEVESVGQKLGGSELKDGYTTPSSSDFKSRNPTARRSLCFEDEEGTNMKRRNRLQVFRNITPSTDSPCTRS